MTLTAHVTRRRKALEKLNDDFNKLRDKWTAETQRVNEKYIEKLKAMKAQIEAEDKDLSDLEARLKGEDKPADA